MAERRPAPAALAHAGLWVATGIAWSSWVGFWAEAVFAMALVSFAMAAAQWRPRARRSAALKMVSWLLFFLSLIVLIFGALSADTFSGSLISGGLIGGLMFVASTWQLLVE